MRGKEACDIIILSVATTTTTSTNIKKKEIFKMSYLFQQDFLTLSNVTVTD